MNNKKLKEDFIKYFGEKVWNQEEALGRLLEYEEILAEYLGVNRIPVIVDKIKDDSRYYVDEDYIAISEDLIMDDYEALKCLIHEYRHYYQKICVTNNDTRIPKILLEQWKNDFNTKYQSMELDKRICLAIEIDAFAFTKYFLSKLGKKSYNYPDEVYNNVLELYIEKYLK